ncbi:MAG: vitamin K epoxide reductase family protein [Anaerolineales bacterium]|jgi:uncharacterized membrane protein/thiol-disulfide isomerase/thioredoxin
MSRWLQVGLALTLAVFGTALQSSNAVVRALLFYSPTCPHCHAVMTESLPPIMAHYQDQLQIVAIDTTTEVGQQLYQAAIQAMGIPEERRGVPTMIVGSTVMVGSYEIPAMLPNLVETGLAQGGVSWPLIPGLDRVLSSEATAGGTPVTAAPSGWGGRFSQDIPGNSLAALVLLGILATTAWALVRVRGRRTAGRGSGKGMFWNQWGIPLVAAAGAGISLYLAYVESTGAPAICGPIGDCNAVQQSEYARLFGVVPIGVLGVVGYGLILAIHFYRRDLSGSAANRASLAIYALGLGGTAFSAYLTFLEIFVIGAVCAWCLSSAVVMAALLALSVPDAHRSLARGRPRRSSA